MAYGFQSFDASGALVFDSNYPVMYMIAADVATVVNPTTVNTEMKFNGIMNPWSDAPMFLIKPPIGMGVDTVKGGSYSSFTGQWLPYQQAAVNIETLVLTSGPMGAQVPYWCFINKVTDSGKRYGMQTFDENGVLTFDSETSQLVANKWIAPSDWIYYGAAQDPSNPSYTMYYYYAPTDGYDSFTILTPGAGDAFDIGEAFIGYRSAWGNSLLWCVASGRNGATLQIMPTVILGKAV